MRLLGFQILLLSAATTLPATASDISGRRPAHDPFMRGMVVSCPRGGQIWGTPLMAEALNSLNELGVEWVAIHPYAGIRRDGTVRRRAAADTDYLQRAGELIRAAGMRIFWKPHLAYWGSFTWRGAIEFDDEASWTRFFDGYRVFILDQARLAESLGVELFSIGVELELTTHRPEWTELIAEVRTVYTGRLTYAANWDSLGAVPFWQQLDLIGVHAYFPLSAEPQPTAASLDTGWDSAFADLRRLSDELGGKPILFAEIGYARSPAAAAEPWAYAVVDTPAVRDLRRQLIELAIERVEREPAVAGMFWWKWIPGPIGHDRDFSMKDPEARDALQRHWGTARVSTAR